MVLSLSLFANPCLLELAFFSVKSELNSGIRDLLIMGRSDQILNKSVPLFASLLLEKLNNAKF